jgi:hypothetical protein
MTGENTPITRAPASGTRTVIETTAAGTPVAILVQYVVTSLLPAVPPEVQMATVALAIGFVGAAFSWARNRGVGGVVTGASR